MSGDLVPLPGAPGVSFEVRRSRDGIYVKYTGTPDALIAARAATADMLVRPAVRSTRKFDEAGNRYRVHRYFGSRQGVPVPRCEVDRYGMSDQNALRLPGVRAALEEIDRPIPKLTTEELAEKRRRAAELLQRSGLAGYTRLSNAPHGGLRLVVNNAEHRRGESAP